MTVSESSLTQIPAIVQIPVYQRLFATAGNLYCRIFHESIYRPVAGQYRCCTSLRRTTRQITVFTHVTTTPVRSRAPAGRLGRRTAPPAAGSVPPSAPLRPPPPPPRSGWEAASPQQCPEPPGNRRVVP